MNSSPDYKRIALTAALVLATLGAAFLVWQFQSVLALVAVSLAVATMVRAPVDRLVRLRVPRGIALLLVYAMGVAVIIAIAFFIAPRLAAELPALLLGIGAEYAAAYSRWLAGGSVVSTLARRLPASDELAMLLQGSATETAGLVLGATLNVFNVLAQSLLVIVISLYWSADRQRFEQLMLSLLPPAQRGRVRAAWREIEQGLGAYLRSEAAQCLLAGALLSLAFWLIGVPFPITAALLTALAWLLPLVGGAVAVGLTLAVAAFGGPLTALLAVACTCAVLLFMEFVVERRLYPRERYGSVLVLLIIIVMVEAIGVLGLLIAPPLAAAIQIALNQWLRSASSVAVVVPSGAVQAEQQTTPAFGGLEPLKARLAAVQERLATAEDASPSAKNLMARLSGLIEEAERAGVGAGVDVGGA